MAIERFTSKRALTCWTVTAIYGLISAATSPLVIHYMPKMVFDGSAITIIVILSIFGIFVFNNFKFLLFIQTRSSGQ